MENHTSSPWRTLKLQFDIGGLCNGDPRQWTLPVVTSLEWAKEGPVSKEYTDTVFSLVGKVDGCNTEAIKDQTRQGLAAMNVDRITALEQFGPS